jgi:hypothetical protein
MRISHCKFLNGLAIVEDLSDYSGKYDRIVTSAWQYDSITRMLTYGATVFTKTSPTDYWRKQMHSKTAVERFRNSPVKVQFIFPEDSEDNFLSNTAINWYIACNLIFKFKCESKETNEELELHYVNVDPVCFNADYDPKDYLLSEYEYLGNENEDEKLNEYKQPTTSGNVLGYLCLGLLTGATFMYLFHLSTSWI